jgi:hypothetical protein
MKGGVDSEDKFRLKNGALILPATVDEDGPILSFLTPYCKKNRMIS